MAGVGVFMAFALIMAIMIILKIRSARAEGLPSNELIKSILPLVVADAAFSLIFVFWFISNL